MKNKDIRNKIGMAGWKFSFLIKKIMREPLVHFWLYGDIQHFWSERFRSNLVYGYADSDNRLFYPQR
jgi:hypothetical protein